MTAALLICMAISPAEDLTPIGCPVRTQTIVDREDEGKTGVGIDRARANPAENRGWGLKRGTGGREYMLRRHDPT
jgi:hypothetical protein